MTHWLETVIALLQADTGDLRELAKIAGANPKTFYRGVRLADLDVEGQDIGGMEFAASSSDDHSDEKLGLMIRWDNNDSGYIEIDGVIAAIRKVPRQEERLALLMKLMLENREFGYPIAERYGRDKAKFANQTLSELKKILKQERDQYQYSLFKGYDRTPTYSDERLAYVLYRTFSRGMPGNRSQLLYYMALYLGKFPQINRLVKSRIDISRSIFLEPYRAEIEKNLKRPKDFDWEHLLPQFFRQVGLKRR